MHQPKTIIENLEVIGTAPDGCTLHKWTEEGGTRVFEERYDYTLCASGMEIGSVYVYEYPKS